MQAARTFNDTEAVSTLARHAGLLSFAAGQDQKAISYYEEALATEPQDAYLYLALSEAYLSSGQTELMREALKRAHELAIHGDDEELEAMLKQKLDTHKSPP